MQPQVLYPLVSMAVVLVILLLRNRGYRHLDPGRLWIVPTLFAGIIGFAIYSAWQASHFPITLTLAEAAILGLIPGAILGWFRGKTIDIRHDDELGGLTAKASMLGIILFVALAMVRTLVTDFAKTHPGFLPFDPGLLSLGLAFFVLGMIATQRVEMFIRAMSVRGRQLAADA